MCWNKHMQMHKRNYTNFLIIKEHSYSAHTLKALTGIIKSLYFSRIWSRFTGSSGYIDFVAKATSISRLMSIPNLEQRSTSCV